MWDYILEIDGYHHFEVLERRLRNMGEDGYMRKVGFVFLWPEDYPEEWDANYCFEEDGCHG